MFVLGFNFQAQVLVLVLVLLNSLITYELDTIEPQSSFKLTPRSISSVTKWTPLCWGRRWTFLWSQALGPTIRPEPCWEPWPDPLLWFAEHAMGGQQSSSQLGTCLLTVWPRVTTLAPRVFRHVWIDKQKLRCLIYQYILANLFSVIIDYWYVISQNKTAKVFLFSLFITFTCYVSFVWCKFVCNTVTMLIHNVYNDTILRYRIIILQNTFAQLCIFWAGRIKTGR